MLRWSLRLACLLCVIVVACGSDPPSASSSLDPPDGGACTPAWSPTWQQGSGANNWWVEYAIGGGTVQSAYLEVVGMGQVPLSNQWNKWVGVSSFSIPRGASVVVHARNTANRDAQTNPFGYLVTTAPTTDPCAGSAACRTAPRKAAETTVAVAAAARALPGRRARAAHA